MSVSNLVGFVPEQPHSAAQSKRKERGKSDVRGPGEAAKATQGRALWARREEGGLEGGAHRTRSPLGAETGRTTHLSVCLSSRQIWFSVHVGETGRPQVVCLGWSGRNSSVESYEEFLRG